MAFIDEKEQIEALRKEQQLLDQQILLMKERVKAISCVIKSVRVLQKTAAVINHVQVPQKTTKKRQKSGYLYRGSIKAKTTLAELAAQAIRLYGPMLIEDVADAIREMNPDVAWKKGSLYSGMIYRTDILAYNRTTRIWDVAEGS